MGYWEDRQKEIFLAGEMKVNQYFTKLERAFNQTKKELQKTIEEFYFRYAKENGLSYTEAQRKLDKEELGELAEFIRLSMQNIGKYNQTVNNMSIKARITRYQALEAQIDAILRQLYAVDYEAMAEQTMQEVYEESYYRTWYNIDQYRGFHAAFAQISPETVEKLLEYPFNGANFSSRLWKQKDHLQTQLMESLTTMMIQGKHPSTLTKDFAKKMQSKKFDAYRLLHTEGSFLMSESAHAAYREDGVEKYQILATLDNKTCGVCGELDGNVYEVGKEIAGVNMQPFHPLCRCTDVPYYDDTDLTEMTRAARDPETGKAYEVPGNMTYNEWKTRFIPKAKEEANSRKRTAKELKKQCADIKDTVETVSGIKSRWSGTIIVDNMLCEQEFCSGEKLWNCDILLRDDVSDHIVVHELLHSCSASYYPPSEYVSHGKIEEGSVEFLAREISYAKGYAAGSGAYDNEVTVLKYLNYGLDLYDTDLEFAKELFSQPLPERFRWLQDKVNEVIMNREDITAEDMQQLTLFMSLLEGGYGS